MFQLKIRSVVTKLRDSFRQKLKLFSKKVKLVIIVFLGEAKVWLTCIIDDVHPSIGKAQAQGHKEGAKNLKIQKV